jgi:carbon monoxide dehydrogenase subunit G
MASVHKEIALPASPEAVWDVVRDVGAVHTRFAPGFVVDTVLEEGARTVTFANGFVARELIVDMDEQRRRLAYSAHGGQLTHHNASFQVFSDGVGSRLVWIADMLPHEAAATVGGMMTDGLEVIRRALSTPA